jgi:hypothetical protein
VRLVVSGWYSGGFFSGFVRLLCLALPDFEQYMVVKEIFPRDNNNCDYIFSCFY